MMTNEFFYDEVIRLIEDYIKTGEHEDIDLAYEMIENKKREKKTHV